MRKRNSFSCGRFRVTWPGFRSRPPLSVETWPIGFLGLCGPLGCLRYCWHLPSRFRACPSPPLRSPQPRLLPRPAPGAGSVGSPSPSRLSLPSTNRVPSPQATRLLLSSATGASPRPQPQPAEHRRARGPRPP
uniref:Uncharacterized protein n=1 Tax=Molossus molossus TaxID=27622 RepID=A0A7J8J7X3_MOLMO|nr:hypothetical protein HJG59_009697 [Molossus molossus]